MKPIQDIAGTVALVSSLFLVVAVQIITAIDRTSMYEADRVSLTNCIKNEYYRCDLISHQLIVYTGALAVMSALTLAVCILVIVLIYWSSHPLLTESTCCSMKMERATELICIFLLGLSITCLCGQVVLSSFVAGASIQTLMVYYQIDKSMYAETALFIKQERAKDFLELFRLADEQNSLIIGNTNIPAFRTSFLTQDIFLAILFVLTGAPLFFVVIKTFIEICKGKLRLETLSTSVSNKHNDD